MYPSNLAAYDGLKSLFIEGLKGDDTISGLGGNDNLSGNGGNDQIDGGTGADTLTGGEGEDVFVLRAGDGGNSIDLADIITDFDVSNDGFGLDDDLQFASLTIEQGEGDNANHTLISNGSEYLALVQNTSASELTETLFYAVDIA